VNSIPISWIVVAGVSIIALLVLAGWVLSKRKKQSLRLQQRFGPEYGRTVDELGGRAKAESELKAREKRVEHLNITALAPSEAARFSEAWGELQSRFVDNPKGVVMQADQLVRELMLKRGYPMGDFEHRAADISVDYPTVVDNYRAAQAIAIRDHRGEANTEDLRQAVVHYRALFDELLEVREAKQGVLVAKPIPVPA
jgi:LPXTG-motif cell wall-anchored protein